ncbi:unnamed protein product [Discula destructiva]
MAVDAGVHLGAIHEILKDTQPQNLGKTDELALPYTLQTGPFAGLTVQSASPRTNAKKIQGDLVDTYLITHPHLDHISGFVVNTAGLAGPRRKKLAGLPGTIQALKTHIFNNTIWPNLSDEDHGAGLFTYMRLNEGGSPAMGNPDGYLEFNEGLAVKVWSVSHGHNVENNTVHRVGSGSGSNTRYGSLDATSGGLSAHYNSGMLSPRSVAHHNASPNVLNLFQQQQQLSHAHDRANSFLPGPSMAMQGSIGRANTMGFSGGAGHSTAGMCVYDSSSYFIRDVGTDVEVLIFGDVEGDSISMNPRNLRIWQEAAPKIVAGKLKAILIECSYDDSRPVERLFGHLTPSFLIEEMGVLADEVKRARTQAVLDRAKELEDSLRRGSKRKREWDDGGVAGGGGGGGGGGGRRRPTRAATREFGAMNASGGGGGTPPPGAGTPSEPVSPRTSMRGGPQTTDGSGSSQQQQAQTSQPATFTLRSAGRSYTADSSSLSPGTSVSHVLPQPIVVDDGGGDSRAQLEGLKVVIIHMKDTMDDEPPIGEIILEELQDHESEMIEDGTRPRGLGCEWIISEVGMSLMV